MGDKIKKHCILWTVVITLIVSWFLFFPWSKQVFEDGGTIVYSSFTYKIYIWNSIGGKNTTEIYYFPFNFKYRSGTLDKWSKVNDQPLIIVCVPVDERFQLVEVWKPLGNGKGRRKELSSKKKYFITVIIFAALYLLSKTVLSQLYLFEWTARHHYLYIWIFSIILLYCKKSIISFSITFGNLFGILIGQFFGDYVRYKNILKITAAMSSEQKDSLYHHPGVEYWIITIIIFTIVGILVNKRRYVRDGSWTGSVLSIIEWNFGKERIHRQNLWRWGLWGK